MKEVDAVPIVAAISLTQRLRRVAGELEDFADLGGCQFVGSEWTKPNAEIAISAVQSLIRVIGEAEEDCISLASLFPECRLAAQLLDAAYNCIGQCDVPAEMERFHGMDEAAIETCRSAIQRAHSQVGTELIAVASQLHVSIRLKGNSRVTHHIEVKNDVVILDGETFSVRPNVAELFQHLCENIGEYQPMGTSVRTRDIEALKSKAPELYAIIESQPGAGTRILPYDRWPE